MKPRIIATFFGVIVLVYSRVNSQEIVGIIPEKYSFDVCSCDLESEYCDINCCCDEYCSDEQIAVFSSCDDILPIFDPKLCSFPKTNHGGLTDKTEASDSLLCIERDNNEDRNIYEAVYPREYLDKVVNLTTTTNRHYPRFGEDVFIKYINNPEYLDVIIITLPSQIIGTLGLPYSLLSSMCDYQIPIKLMQDKISECHQHIAYLPQDCDSLPLLDANSYHNFEILNYTNEKTIFICKNNMEDCDISSISPPDFENDICHNMVSEVHYIITYSVPFEIKNFTVKFMLQEKNYAGNPVILKQKFGVTFQHLADSDSFVISGNPGYVKGKPVLGGWLSEDQIKFNSSSWLSLPVVGAETSCLRGKLHPVIFGENVITSCVIHVNASDLRRNCSYTGILQESYLFLYKNFPTHIGIFGNADPNVLGDWVPILIKNPRNFLNSDCNLFVLALHIEVAFVYIGLESNPQAKIIGSVFEYSRPTPILSCVGFSSKNNLTLSIPLHISLSFVDVTKSPKTIYAPLPTLDIKLPYDFFYPFVAKAKAKTISVNQILIYSLFYIVYKVNIFMCN